MTRRKHYDVAIIGLGAMGSFAAVELEVHEQTRRQADLYVAGLLAKASKQAQTRPHIDKVIKAAEAALRPVEKKDAPWLCGLLEDWRSR